MFVRALVVTGFRNLEGCVPLCEPLAVLLGENNAGKSSVIDALRILFAPEAGPRGRRWITEQDFRHDPAGVRTTDVLELEAQLTGLTPEEQARMVTCLAPSLGAGCAKFLAHRALDLDRQIGLLLPCNVVVRADGDTRSVVSALDPQVMVTVPENEDLRPIADDAGRRIRTALDTLSAPGAASGGSDQR